MLSRKRLLGIRNSLVCYQIFEPSLLGRWHRRLLVHIWRPRKELFVAPNTLDCTHTHCCHYYLLLQSVFIIIQNLYYSTMLVPIRRVANSSKSCSKAIAFRTSLSGYTLPRFSLGAIALGRRPNINNVLQSTTHVWRILEKAKNCGSYDESWEAGPIFC